MNKPTEKTEDELNAEAAARVRTPKFQRALARRKAAAAKWHLTHEA